MLRFLSIEPISGVRWTFTAQRASIALAREERDHWPDKNSFPMRRRAIINKLGGLAAAFG